MIASRSLAGSLFGRLQRNDLLPARPREAHDAAAQQRSWKQILPGRSPIGDLLANLAALGALVAAADFLHWI